MLIRSFADLLDMVQRRARTTCGRWHETLIGKGVSVRLHRQGKVVMVSAFSEDESRCRETAVVSWDWVRSLDLARLEVFVMSFLRKPADGAAGARKGVKAVDKEVSKQWPALWEYLTSEVWPDGSERKSSTLLLFVEGGSCKGMVNDRDGGMVAFVTSDTFRGLLEAVEGGLKDGKLDWRVSQGGGGKKR